MFRQTTATTATAHQPFSSSSSLPVRMALEPILRPKRPIVMQWFVDTRPLWPEATETRQLNVVARRALAALLSDDERAAVLRYVHVRDAKMALASQLLKHLVVARCGGTVPWRETHLTREGGVSSSDSNSTTTTPSHGKPTYREASTGHAPVAFNVSHQAGVVVLVGVWGGDDDAGTLFEAGVDVVAPSERRVRDHKMVHEESSFGGGLGAVTGWARFVNLHADAFAPCEAAALRSLVRPSLDDRLRRFYTLWCLREAYIKMTGEALLAPWLRDLEVRSYDVPLRLATEQVARPDLWLRGRRVTNVNIRLAALCIRSKEAADDDDDDDDDYVVCTAIRSPGKPAAALALTIGDFEEVAMHDIVLFAERYGSQ